jgi:hypothetical protein
MLQEMKRQSDYAARDFLFILICEIQVENRWYTFSGIAGTVCSGIGGTV